MPCNLTATRQVLVMTDLAGEQYEQYYRNPTNAERVAYSNSLFEKKKGRTVPKENVFAEQVAFGKKLAQGFSEGYFMDGDDFISSDPAKPFFRKDWKDLVEQARPTDFQQIAIAAVRPASPAEDMGDGQPGAAEGGDADPDENQADGGDQADAEAQAKAEEAPLGSSSEAS